MSILNIASKRFRRKSKKQLEQPKVAHSFKNIVDQNFTHNVCVTDITYLPSKDGTEYLSVIKNMKDKSIVAFNFSTKNDLDLVMKTIKKVSLPTNTILHSDQGSQYTSMEYHKHLAEKGLTGSMSRKGNPYDNSPIESFFSILKNEELKLFKSRTKAETRKLVEDFVFHYNNERPQWNLKKLTPIEYGNQFFI